MGRLIVVGLLVIGGMLAWRIGQTLSSDAISMLLGIVFGVFAMLPGLLLSAASNRQESWVEEPQRPVSGPARPALPVTIDGEVIDR